MLMEQPNGCKRIKTEGMGESGADELARSFLRAVSARRLDGAIVDHLLQARGLLGDELSISTCLGHHLPRGHARVTQPWLDASRATVAATATGRLRGKGGVIGILRRP